MKCEICQKEAATYIAAVGDDDYLYCLQCLCIAKLEGRKIRHSLIEEFINTEGKSIPSCICTYCRDVRDNLLSKLRREKQKKEEVQL